MRLSQHCAADVSREAFEGAESDDSTARPSPVWIHTAQVCFQETSCWILEKGGGDILYQGCESQFHALYFSYGGLAGWLSGWQGVWRGMCCGPGPSAEGLTRRLGQGVAGLLHGLGGAYLNQSPVWTIALRHCYCTAAAWDTKAEKLEIWKRKKRVRLKEKVITGGGERREEVWIMLSILPRKRHKQ